MLIFRKKSSQFCTPRLKTQQPVLPYYSSSLLDQLNWSNEGLSIHIPLVVDNLPDRNSKNLVSNDTVIVWVAYLVLNDCSAFKLPFGRAQIVSVSLFKNSVLDSIFLASYILRGPQKFAKSSFEFWLAMHGTKVRWRFPKILWPSQNIWILTGSSNVNTNLYEK